MYTRLIAANTATLAVLSLGLTGCSSDSGTTKSAAVAEVQGPAAPVGASSAPERVDAARFAEVVATPGVQIIDVRTPEEFTAGHIAGAVNYDLQGSSFLDRVAALDPSGTYAVYCRSGNRSQPAVAAMADAGITSIYELSTGIIGWQDAGLPTVQ